MGKSIFITYKYGDTRVLRLKNILLTKVRDYVDELQTRLDKEDHLNKGEEDGQSLKDFTDETIESKLRDKIFHSSVTIFMISKGMREVYASEKDQWIPWEISYSLKEHTRDGRTSLSNALLAVVLPDENASDTYYWHYDQACQSIMYNTNALFQIIKANMFNLKQSKTSNCNGNIIHSGPYSYIYSVKWDDFIGDINKHIQIAVERNERVKDYDITKTV